MGNGSLWSDVVLRKKSFPLIWFWDLKFRISNIWNHTTWFDKGVFFFHSYLATPTTKQAKIFTGLLLCWDTPSEKTGLWHLPIVSSVFNHYWCTLRMGCKAIHQVMFAPVFLVWFGSLLHHSTLLTTWWCLM